jgi:PBSX family phage portal protein
VALDGATGERGEIDIDPQGRTTRVDESARTPLSTAFSNEVFEEETLFSRVHALPPPSGNPRDLNTIFRQSYPLRVCVEAMRTNIATHGYSVEPCVDLENPDHVDDYRDAINLAFEMGEDRFVREGLVERAASEQDVMPDDVADYASDFEISEEGFAAAQKRLRRRQKADEFRLRAFLASAFPQTSYHRARDEMTADYEIHGYAFWEVVLSTDGKQTPLQVVHVPSWTMRLMPEDKQSHATKVVYPMSPAVLGKKVISTRYRLYAQKDEISGRLVYYKALGDDRIYSARSGTKYDSIDKMLEAEKAKWPNVRAANAMIHFFQYDPESPYGSPRWWGALSNIVGTKGAEYVNERFFDNKAIPAGLITITDGQANKQDMEALKKDWRAEVSGVENFHNLMFLQVDGMANPMAAQAGRGAQVKFVPLSNASPTDGQFQNYLNRNQDVVGTTFRLGRPVRGDMRDLNRATARVSVQLAEKQVFQPDRARYDEIVNTRLLPALGIYNVKVRSNPPDMTDPEEILNLLDISNKGGIFTTEESRTIASMLTGEDYRKVEGEWGKMPLRLLLGGFRVDETGKVVPIAESGGADGAGAPTPRSKPSPEGGENKDT